MSQMSLDLQDFRDRAVVPMLELGAYEALWAEAGASFKSLAAKFSSIEDSRPSDFVSAATAKQFADRTLEILGRSGVDEFGVRVHGAAEYPSRLRVAEHPVEFLYYQGGWDFIFSPVSVAVVGTRNPSPEGVKRTRQLVRQLVEDNVTVVSGLARGIDFEAHRTCIETGGRTIAVLGTPISRFYPAEHSDLQREIADKHLLISQVPIYRYEQQQNPTANRFFFPERNVTMSALTDATVIVEAGETSGTLVQARAALAQKRKLFILDSCFRTDLVWPAKMEAMGAIRVTTYDDIRRHILPNEAN